MQCANGSSNVQCSGSNVQSSKPVSDSSVCSSKPNFGSSVHASKPVIEHVRVSDVRPSEPTSSIHSRSNNIVSASNICPSKPSVLVMFV